MTVDEVLDYVMHTPHNTNRQVLEYMLNRLIADNSGGSAGPDVGPDEAYIIYDGGPAEGWPRE